MQEFLFDFEKLDVYQKSLDLIDKIFEAYKSLSQDCKISVGSNLIRAAMSVANNLAEGNGKKSKKEKNRYFGISLDSARECISVFNVLKRQGLITVSQYDDLRSNTRQITNMLWGLMNSQV